ncbi:MAG: hypothetical protein A3C50_03125 [Candidatus Staskawiczbacteria bacterium RIFCSPHIGHO2_02_FULL_43_16]|uniref:Ferric oxidoreductase domain-containing protein n=1 Tax=Candidatus Staskawiczbacteria bacterium RIFCSPHIGHO2_01_FULL_41_41 TaxID=1802203 RepID=A0A1G2HUA8_9BACT|nr:MAG: hypothetical protein A2822_02995 [Candidatus Staskawiczbacteria bacterium RIFCSPHIGHO2_01_FULL_41_41]OGZ68695.1 MAG: hypothetical protein A3C50_03125 [Candidatus Staskawiczbacteria bacterium RIFCSPHIGHO2_02_FULL_43_16]OGZ75157.1 MAG: hypothetical protein A3A12_01050 [Candidatus Staskawiczbacteria bacterium RIFCSPLOWO2_01_FULL_43_17b]
MTNKITNYIIVAGACLAVAYPLWVRASSLIWALDATLPQNLFPLFGLAAASLLWLHAISGAFEPWLRANFDFDAFVQRTATLILICLIAHPLLLLISLGFRIWDLYAIYDITYIYLGVVVWLLLISYDIFKPFKKSGFFARNWNAVLIISNIGFLLTFLHSLALGSDLQTNPLRFVWIFYGITATLAIIYTYGMRRFLK